MKPLSPLVKELAETVSDRMETDGLLLFGSYARGDFVAESDMDFVTLGEEFQRKIFKDTNPQLDVWTHPAEPYRGLINGVLSDPFQDSLFIGILQESILLYEDRNSLFKKSIEVALDWSWPNETLESLTHQLEKTQALLAKSGISEPIVKHIQRRIGLFGWNRQRASNGLPFLRRLKDIYRSDSEAKIGLIAKGTGPEVINKLQSMFTSIAEGTLTEIGRQPFTEIKDTIKAFHASRLNEWALSMIDSLVFLGAMELENRGQTTKWKLLDVESEVSMLENARRNWDEYRILYDELSEIIKI